MANGESAQTVRSELSTLTTDGPLPVPSNKYPKPSEQAVEFIETIVPSDFDDLKFDDELVTFSETGNKIGDFKIRVSTGKQDSQEYFLVNAISQGVIDGVLCGTSIMAYISKSMQTLKQFHHEFVNLPNSPLDKKTTITKVENEYQLKRVIVKGSDVEKTYHSFPADVMRGFICEGSSLLLQRILIKKGLPDDFKVISLDSDANLCLSFYTELASKSQTVDGQPLLVSGIERSIESLTDLPTVWQSYFDQYGHLTSRVQVGSPAVMRVIKVPEPVINDKVLEKPHFEKKKLDWEDDLQLNSVYQDRKSEMEDDHASYLRHHPEINCLLSDFMQFLLLRKPDDVLNFAGEYFASFSCRALETSAYATSNAPTPFPPSRTNTLLSMKQKLKP